MESVSTIDTRVWDHRGAYLDALVDVVNAGIAGIGGFVASSVCGGKEGAETEQ